MNQQLHFRFLILISILFLSPNSLFASEKISENHMPTLRGEKASEYLNKNNLSNSLNEAFEKANNQNSLNNPLSNFINFRQSSRLLAGDVSRDGASGFSVAISGHTAVIGAPKDRKNRGAVYVFVRKKVQNAIVWEAQAKLMAARPQIREYFGWSVAIDGNTIIVGAPEYDSRKTFNVGTAYVFTRKGDHWAEQIRLKESDEFGHIFGYSVDISGNIIVVGSPAAAKGRIVTPSTKLNDFRAFGSIYIYKRDLKGVWKEHQKIFGKDLGVGLLGNRIGIHGKTIVARSMAMKDTMPKSCDYAGTKNLVHIFTEGVTKWSLKQTLTPCDYLKKEAFKSGDVEFGISLAIDGSPKLGTSIVVESRKESSSKERLIYVFNNKKGVANKPNFKKWHLEGMFQPSDDTKEFMFETITNTRVAISGDKIIVGGNWLLPGKAYIYKRQRTLKGIVWEEKQKVITNDSSGGFASQFAQAVAIDKDTVLIGSPGHDRKQRNSNKGVAYIFTPPGIDLKFPNL